MRYGRHGHELSNNPTTGSLSLTAPRQVAPRWNGKTNLTTEDGAALYASDQLSSSNPFLWTQDGRMFAPDGVTDPRYRMLYRAVLLGSQVKLNRAGRLLLGNGITARGALIILPDGRTLPLVK